MSGQVRHAIEGPLGWIVFDHAERRNALSGHMWGELATAAASLDRDEQVRVVIMRGAGETAFVSGADISQFAETSGAETSANLRAGGGDAFAVLARLRKPLIAMIHGYCIGGGVAVALAADLRYAADDASFAIPAARLGVGYHLEGVAELIELVGPAHAREIFYSARRYDAAEALRMGLVNRVYAKEALEAEVRALARRIAANAPLTVRSVKLIARELRKPDARRDAAMVDASIRACFDSEDFREGVAAFLEKREPRFRGK